MKDRQMTTATTPIAVGTWAIDPVHSSVDFSVRHLMVSKVRGTFETFSGTITVAPDGTPSVTAQIDVASLNTGSEQRDGHVKSGDFFDVENHPVATFTSTSVRPHGDDYFLDGDLTLKGVTRPVTLDLEFNGVSPGQGYGEVSGYEASVVLSRKDFGIDIDIPMETGGAVVGDRITVTLEIEAIKQS
jgi:polyisoprenoid-binding protein YceI